MALKKEIVLTNGVIANYHNISNVNREGGIVKILVSSYANKNQRLEELECNRQIREYDWNNGSDEDYHSIAVKCNRKVWVHEFTLDDVESFSFSEIYDKLKRFKMFEGAEDD